MAANADTSPGSVVVSARRGIPVEILDGELDNKLLCTVCKLLPRNPFQGFCGHRFCDSCITDQLTRFVS